MTRFQALFVLLLRCKHDGSWRWIDARYSDRYIKKIPYLDGRMEVHGNQIKGRLLCVEASRVLGITVD